MGLPASGSAEAPSSAGAGGVGGALIRSQRQAGPWRHPADPDGACISEGRPPERWGREMEPLDQADRQAEAPAANINDKH